MVDLENPAVPSAKDVITAPISLRERNTPPPFADIAPDNNEILKILNFKKNFKF